ncbi:MAG: redoxin domain-containing protein [Planctomycetaceae bacterium]|nr:redoxin domain-containing protein [Planctomycetaceae bacterium]
MVSRFVLVTLFCLGTLLATPLRAEENTPQQSPARELPGVQGSRVKIPLPQPERITVFCFLGTECPLARLYGPRLQQLSETYAGKVDFIGINSNLQDELTEIEAYVNTAGIRFPFAKDYENRLADELLAERTPEIVVIDPAGQVRYRGRVDDQYLPGVAKAEPTRDDLKIALEQLVTGKDVEVPETKAVGCLMGKVLPGETTTSLTYCHDIAPLLQKHCVECHREGEIGPFSLTSFDEILGWGSMILEVVEEGRMPPWHANPEKSSFANQRLISAAEKQLLRDWVNGGMPYGDVAELPPAPEPSTGWHMSREPDAVYPMHSKPFEVPAEGIVDYQYYVVDPGFEKEMWINGAEVIPGNRAVVHHTIVFIRPPDGTELRGLGWVAAYVPGQRSVMLPPGHGRRIPAGSKLVFQMHYTPNGSVQEDITKLGLVFLEREQVTHEVATLMAINSEFEIPPHADNFRIEGKLTNIPKGGSLIAVSPHMHYRGKGIRVYQERNEQQEILLDVPHYDFNWQHVYELNEPQSLGDVKSFSFEAWFDNSASNPYNPDPEAYVTWGEQSSEEMAIAFFEVASPVKDQDDKTEEEKKPETISPEKQQRIDAFVKDFFKRFDQDGDGKIKKDELPTSLSRFAFHRFDQNHDGLLLPDEFAELAKSNREI